MSLPGTSRGGVTECVECYGEFDPERIDEAGLCPECAARNDRLNEEPWRRL